MIRRQRLREISAAALLVAMATGSAMAQEALPTIEVGAPRKVAHRPTSKATPKPKPVPVPVAAAPAPKPEVERAEEKFDATQKASSEQFTTGKAINDVPFRTVFPVPGIACERRT